MERRDILTFSYYEAGGTFTGSNNGMRFMIKPVDRDDKKVLCVYTWEEDLAHEYVSESDMRIRDFEFSKDGLEEVFLYLVNDF